MKEAPQTRRDPRPHPSGPGLQKPTSQDPCPPQRRGSLTAAQLPATEALSAARVPMTHMAPPPRAWGGGCAHAHKDALVGPVKEPLAPGGVGGTWTLGKAGHQEAGHGPLGQPGDSLSIRGGNVYIWPSGC